MCITRHNVKLWLEEPWLITKRTAITFWVSACLKYWLPASIESQYFVSALCGTELEGDKTIQESPWKILQSYLCPGTVCQYLQLLLIDGFCSKYPVLGRRQPLQAICCSVPLAFCWKVRQGCQMCVIPSPKTGFSSSPLQLTLWHSSCPLSGLLDLKVSCSVIYLLLRNKLLFSSDPLILPSCCHGAARLDSGGITCVGEILSVLPDTQALCRPARLLLNDALPKKSA